eukprot:14525674-Heterocapsa_arctica.AAC.1
MLLHHQNHDRAGISLRQMATQPQILPVRRPGRRALRPLPRRGTSHTDQLLPHRHPPSPLG